MAKMLRVIFCTFMGFFVAWIAGAAVFLLLSDYAGPDRLGIAISTIVVTGGVGSILGFIVGLLWKVPKQPK